MKFTASLIRNALLRALHGAALKVFIAGFQPELKPAYIRIKTHSRRPQVLEGEFRRLEEPNRW